jgi:hypothetical protein
VPQVRRLALRVKGLSGNIKSRQYRGTRRIFRSEKKRQNTVLPECYQIHNNMLDSRGHRSVLLLRYWSRVRRSFPVRSETKRNGSKILFASKRTREVCFACFALKRNSRFHMRSEKEMKRNEAKKAKRNERSKAKETNRK